MWGNGANNGNGNGNGNGTQLSGFEDLAQIIAKRDRKKQRIDEMSEAERQAEFVRALSAKAEKLAKRYGRRPWQIRAVLESLALRYGYK